MSKGQESNFLWHVSFNLGPSRVIPAVHGRLENVSRNELGQRPDVYLALEFESDLA